MASNEWSEDEVEATVEDYFSMLEAEQSGTPFNKAEHRRKLMPLLNERTHRAIDSKHQNISAILEKNGYPRIIGYKPRGNYQKLLESVVLEKVYQSDGMASNMYPLEAYSWRILSSDVAIKQMDKSSFLHHGSGVPKDLAFYFDAAATDPRKDITLLHDGQEFEGVIQPDPRQDRVRLFWKKDFDDRIIGYFPEEYHCFKEDKAVEHPPELRFSRVDGYKVYRVDFIAPGKIEETPTGLPEEKLPAPQFEGAKKVVSTTVRKRSAINRHLAIQYHGLNCVVCGFNFERVYGERGKGFIEVHHLTPLHEASEKQNIDPRTDLLPLCSNCHKMIHREPGNPLSIEELKELLSQNE